MKFFRKFHCPKALQGISCLYSQSLVQLIILTLNSSTDYFLYCCFQQFLLYEKHRECIETIISYIKYFIQSMCTIGQHRC